MSRFPLLLAVFAVLLSLSACSGSSGTTGSGDDIVVYTSEADIEGDFEVVGFLQQPEGGRGGYGNDSQVLPQMKAMAARLGANALLVISDSAEIADARVRAAASQGASYNRSRYVAIMVAAE